LKTEAIVLPEVTTNQPLGGTVAFYDEDNTLKEDGFPFLYDTSDDVSNWDRLSSFMNEYSGNVSHIDPETEEVPSSGSGFKWINSYRDMRSQVQIVGSTDPFRSDPFDDDSVLYLNQVGYQILDRDLTYLPFGKPKNTITQSYSGTLGYNDADYLNGMVGSEIVKNSTDTNYLRNLDGPMVMNLSIRFPGARRYPRRAWWLPMTFPVRSYDSTFAAYLDLNSFTDYEWIKTPVPQHFPRLPRFSHDWRELSAGAVRAIASDDMWWANDDREFRSARVITLRRDPGSHVKSIEVVKERTNGEWTLPGGSTFRKLDEKIETARFGINLLDSSTLTQSFPQHNPLKRIVIDNPIFAAFREWCEEVHGVRTDCSPRWYMENRQILVAIFFNNVVGCLIIDHTFYVLRLVSVEDYTIDTLQSVRSVRVNKTLLERRANNEIECAGFMPIKLFWSLRTIQGKSKHFRDHFVAVRSLFVVDEYEDIVGLGEPTENENEPEVGTFSFEQYLKLPEKEGKEYYDSFFKTETSIKPQPSERTSAMKVDEWVHRERLPPSPTDDNSSVRNRVLRSSDGRVISVRPVKVPGAVKFDGIFFTSE
jgi:hypothetical protein